MRFRTLEIRWHDSKPISSCDFQPIPSFKKARPPNGQGQDERWATQSYKLATGGEDNHVRVRIALGVAFNPFLTDTILSGMDGISKYTPFHVDGC